MPPDPGRAFEQVVAVVEEFCPRVEVLRPGACAIGARGPARYFGGEEALAGKIIEAVTGGGFACQAGVADGLFAAQLAARAAAPVTVRSPPGRHGSSLPRTRSACWTVRRWPNSCPGWTARG